MFKKTYLIAILISLILMSFTINKQKYTANQLIGKEKIELYGKGNYRLQKEAYFSLEKLIKEAGRQGVKIKVVSSYRGFNHQNRIWKRKYNKYIKQGLSSKQAVEKVKEYTAIPGTSRHHWGTDVDLSTDYSLENSSRSKLIKWMDINAHKYGFYRVYTKNKLRNGYNYESWHYSYRKLSNPMLKQYNKLDLVKVLKSQNIEGNDNFTTTFINSYKENNVFGINDYLY